MEQNINVPQIGMSMKHPSQIKEGEFSLLLNGLVQNVSGDFMLISNEQSNILGSKFKEGFKVLGTNVVPSLSCTFFFLVNSATQESEIGFLFDATNQDKPDVIGADNKIIEQTPLEQRTQFENSIYYTFVNANCLDFDIDHPITSFIKIDDCNVRIYFNDFKNKPRFIDYKNFQKIDILNCPLIETNELDCDKIKLFPESCYPVIDVVDIVPGGQNLAGVYQFAICYSDATSNKITDYYYVTNPVSLYDKPIVVATNYPLYKSIKLTISNLNTDFKNFNLAVLKTINNVTSVQLVETFEINSNYFEYVYSGVDKNIQLDLSIDEILQKRPYYTASKITTESNGVLMMANLKEDRVWNLQPVVSEILPKWQTVEMNEGDYANLIISQNTVGYLGDEVYPKGISFTKTNGKQTNVFLFVNRDATPYDLEDVSNVLCTDNPCKVLQPTPSGNCTNPDVITGSTCSTTDPLNKRWQVYNTASVDTEPLICITENTENAPLIILEDFIDCTSEEVFIKSIDDNENNNPNPTFYTFDPNVTYPPDTKQDVAALETYLNTHTLDINDFYQNNICDCQTLANEYPKAPSGNPTLPTGVPTIANPIINVEDVNTSVEIVTDPYIYTENIYDGASKPKEVSNPKGIPKQEPDPCKRYSSNDKNEDIGYIAWMDSKQNGDSTNSTNLVQSSDNTCVLEAWGSYITPDNSPSESWYSFYCTNPDKVASILFSTGNGNSANITVYGTDIQGNINTTEIQPPNILQPFAEAISVYPITNKGIYAFLKNLKQGGLYYIKVTGQYNVPDITNLTRLNCDSRTFKICVTSPNPVDSTKTIIPGTAKIIKTCKITYEGTPENSCKPRPFKQGEFGYWESQETYPCNEEVWGDLAGKPIRHFKYPDHNISPFYDSKGSIPNKLSTKLNKIYPKGWVVDINEIKLALDKAVVLGLISFEEKNEICGYRLYRGNRRGNQSIIAKGLLYDVWEYKDNIYNTGNKVMFPNFPYNDLKPNIFVKEKPIRNIFDSLDISRELKHPFEFQERKNNKYTLDAPNLSFNNPGLGTEIKLEFEQNGVSVGNYNPLKNNAEYQYIGAGIISAAIGFASVEAAFEGLNTMVSATLTLDLKILGSGTSIPLGLILALIGENIIAPVRMYSHYGEWYEIIKKFAPFRNYGVTYSSVGKYITHRPNCIGNQRRTIANAQYIKPGIINVKTIKGSSRFNNYKRDSSVFIELAQNSFFRQPLTEDNSRKLPTDCKSTGITGDISSYYASLKNTLLSQYGQVDNIEWIDTGYNGRIHWNVEQNTSCDTIFGGDTFINRFTKKRKVPTHLEDRVFNSTSLQVANQNLDIQMSLMPNIGYPRFFMNYPTSLDYDGVTQSLFGDVAVLSKSRADYNFYCFGSDGKSWADAGLASAVLGSFAGASFGVISLPIAVGIITAGVKKDLGNDVFLKGKYIHSFYGITSFLCESDYNLDLRHGENFKEGDFYPNVGDINEWTQEYNVPINEDNKYSYNLDYSKQNKENPNFVLNNNFKQFKEDCKVLHPNRLIYSLQDNDQNDNFDGNKIFLADNMYEYPKSGGALQIVRGISNNRVLMVAENGYEIANSYISQETNIGTSTVGSNSMFNKSIPLQSIKTDIGTAGSQTQAIISTEFGQYWVDNKRSQILNLQDTQPINLVKPEEEWWFKENLPFHILEDFPEFDITNNFKYVGMVITYDQRYKRVIFTKRDVELKPLYKKHVQYDGNLFQFGDEKFTPDNTKYFCNKSWTISYNPLLKSFTSFHTYVPNYYVQNQGYFSSGYNFSFNNLPEETGVWHHNLTNQSYQVFYGKLQPFMFEYTLQTKYANNMLSSISYISEYLRYQDNISYGLVPGLTYNKAFIYNQKQSTGLLELIVKEKNNRQNSYMYASGKQNADSRSILVEKINNIWSFNNFYNVATYDSGQPLLNYTCDNIAFKELNPLSISYKQQYLKEKMVSDYEVVRLINDRYSNYAINHRLSITQTNPYNQ